MLKIGNVNIENNVFLAPMAGVTDRPYRIICKEFGCGLVYTEMVSAKGLFYNSKNTEILLSTDKKERPVAAQIFGSDPEILADMANKIEQTYNIDIIDINMGCPVPKVVNNKEGSALMKNPELVGKIVNKVANAINIPLTIKIRKGFDDSNINAVEIAKIAEENGAAAIAVHGRTREQYYSGQADWNIIKQVKDAVSIPVIGNGDIFKPEDAKNLFDQTGCDAIMIARGAQGNPWIFKRVLHYITTGEILPEPTTKEKIEKMLEHAQMLIDYKGEYTAVREMRKHVAWYTKGMYDTTKLRRKINHITSYEELNNTLMNYFKEIQV